MHQNGQFRARSFFSGAARALEANTTQHAARTRVRHRDQSNLPRNLPSLWVADFLTVAPIAAGGQHQRLPPPPATVLPSSSFSRAPNPTPLKLEPKIIPLDFCSASTPRFSFSSYVRLRFLWKQIRQKPPVFLILQFTDNDLVLCCDLARPMSTIFNVSTVDSRSLPPLKNECLC